MELGLVRRLHSDHFLIISSKVSGPFQNKFHFKFLFYHTLSRIFWVMKRALVVLNYKVQALCPKRDVIVDPIFTLYKQASQVNFDTILGLERKFTI